MTQALVALGVTLALLGLVALRRVARFADLGQSGRAHFEAARFGLAVLAALTCFAIAMGRPA